jgi:hypothetical protein
MIRALTLFSVLCALTFGLTHPSGSKAGRSNEKSTFVGIAKKSIGLFSSTAEQAPLLGFVCSLEEADDFGDEAETESESEENADLVRTVVLATQQPDFFQQNQPLESQVLARNRSKSLCRFAPARSQLGDADAPLG